MIMKYSNFAQGQLLPKDQKREVLAFKVGSDQRETCPNKKKNKLAFPHPGSIV
jgi:hypothetical protein